MLARSHHTHTPFSFIFRILFFSIFFLPHPCEAEHLAAITTTPYPFGPHTGTSHPKRGGGYTYPLPEPPPCFSTNFHRGTRHTHTADAHNHNNKMYSLLTLETWQRHITHPPSAAEDWCSFFTFIFYNNNNK